LDIFMCINSTQHNVIIIYNRKFEQFCDGQYCISLHIKIRVRFFRRPSAKPCIWRASLSKVLIRFLRTCHIRYTRQKLFTLLKRHISYIRMGTCMCNKQKAYADQIYTKNYIIHVLLYRVISPPAHFLFLQ